MTQLWAYTLPNKKKNIDKKMNRMDCSSVMVLRNKKKIQRKEKREGKNQGRLHVCSDTCWEIRSVEGYVRRYQLSCGLDGLVAKLRSSTWKSPES